MTFRGVQGSPNVPLLIRLGIVARVAADRYANPTRVREVPMASFTAAVYKTACLQFRDQLAQLPRHSSINLVSEPALVK
jgi:hypothetical protein